MLIVEEILKKFKDVLTEEDLKSFQEEITKFLTEESEKRSKLLYEEKVKELEANTEKYLDEAKEEIKKTLIEDYDKKMEELEEKLVIALDTFCDKHIAEKISNDLISKIAINETLLPVVNGIKKVFENSHLELDTEGTGIVKKLQEEKENLSKQLSETIAEKLTIIEEKIKLSESLEKISVKSLILEKVEGLSDEQKERVVKMFENKKFDEVKSNIDSMIDLVIKEEVKPNPDSKDTKTIVEGDGIKDTKIKEVLSEEDQLIRLAKNF